MGRRSAPNQGPFYRSLFSWLSLWALIATVTGIGVWVFVGTVAGDDVRPVVASGSKVAEAEPEPTVSGVRIKNDSQGSVATPAPVETTTSDPAKLKPAGVSVQVLNGTLDDRAAQATADRLSRLGYSIVAVEESRRVYTNTTVFWSTPASRNAAVALADHFGWVAEPKPANLSDTVSLHVVVGADET